MIERLTRAAIRYWKADGEYCATPSRMDDEAAEKFVERTVRK